MHDKHAFGASLLRLVLGLLFIVPGVSKLMGMLGGGHMVVDMLWGQAWLAWVLLLVEILFGLAVLLGWQLKWTVWPLVVIMLGALVVAVVPMGGPMMMVNALFHLLAVAGLVSLFLTGPGAWAVGHHHEM